MVLVPMLKLPLLRALLAPLLLPLVLTLLAPGLLVARPQVLGQERVLVPLASVQVLAKHQPASIGGDIAGQAAPRARSTVTQSHIHTRTRKHG